MDPRALKIASSVVSRSGPGRPADAVLREDLRSQRSLPRDVSRVISRAVFSYFRWRQWLDRSAKMGDQIMAAVELASRYARDPRQFTDEELVAKSLPDWIRSEIEVTPAMARALQTEPVLWLRARPGRGPELASRLGDCMAAGEGPLADALRYDGSLDLFRTPEFQAGDFEIQNIHSQCVGWLCAPKPGESWWDTCVGEGGKLLHLSDLMRNKGQIWGTDRAAWRLQRLKRRTARAKVFNYRSASWDGGPALPVQGRFDGVLVDAPCTNMGTWHRNPHARWTATPSDLKELAAAQIQLLITAASAVKPGGRMIYAVCTLTRSETVDVAAAFEKHCPDFAPMPLPYPFGGQPPAAQQWFLPQDRGGNGMFVALWRKAQPPTAPPTQDLPQDPSPPPAVAPPAS